MQCSKLLWFGVFCFVPPSMGAFIVKQILWEQNSIWFWHPVGHTDDFWNILISDLHVSMFVWFGTMQGFLHRHSALCRPVSVAGRCGQAEGVQAALQDVWF